MRSIGICSFSLFALFMHASNSKASSEHLLSSTINTTHSDSKLTIEPIEHTSSSPSKKYIFDETLLLGTNLKTIDTNQLNSEEIILPGTYRLDIFLNKKRISLQDIELTIQDGKTNAEPCFTEEMLVNIIKTKRTKETSELSSECLPLPTQIAGSSFNLNFAEQRLDLTIPHAFVNQKQEYNVPPEELDMGDSMLFVNYDTSIYHSKTSNFEKTNSTFAYGALASGINIGKWQLRNFSNINHIKTSNLSATQFKSISTYAKRPLPSIKSQIIIGDAFTSGNFFSGISFRGIKIETDNRLLPISSIGYAPEVRGNANTSARVIIRQNGNIIKEVNVAPGPFIIDDISAQISKNDLNVEVIEADGTISTFIVPFSAVPESMRPGQSSYSASLGQVNEYSDSKEKFAELIYQRGINNSLTANTGIRVAKDYTSILAGTVLASEYGAFGFSGIFSSAIDADDTKVTGWRAGINYSKNINSTKTNFSLAGYRYSTDGFRELTDIIGSRASYKYNETWYSSTYKQKNQLTLSINQHLGNYGSIYISASNRDFHDNEKNDTTLQVGYANQWKDLSYNLMWSQQNAYYYQDYIDLVSNDYNEGKKTNTITLSLSLPLGNGRYSPNLTSNISKSTGNIKTQTYNTGMNGSIGKNNDWYYSLSANHDKLLSETYLNSSLSTQTPIASISGSYAQGSNYKQASASASGALVLHTGGITLGPRLSETFALVEAKGARGAAVSGPGGARIDRNGYALVNYLSPYSYNNIGLNPEGIDFTTEIVESTRNIAPYPGASIKVKFETIKGYPVIITTKLEDEKQLPLGAAVYDHENIEVGIVGQGNQIYARVKEPRDSLTVRWSDDIGDQCKINYEINTDEKPDIEFYSASSICIESKK